MIHTVVALAKGQKMDAVYQNASAKAARRLIPFLILCYVVAYLDRVNAGLAALTMNKELGLTAGSRARKQRRLLLRAN